jgi:hypothetical protein
VVYINTTQFFLSCFQFHCYAFNLLFPFADWVHSASWVQLRSYLEEKVAAKV